MAELHPILAAALTGFVFGLLLSIPVGPVNLTIIHEGSRKGFVWAALIGLGASLMELIYCAIAFTGFASFFQQGYVKAVMELVSFAFMLGLGLHLFLLKTVTATDKIEEKIETRLHPHSAFMTGFVRVMGNPNVLLFWIVLAALFTSRGWVAPTFGGKIACVLGVALGTSLWFLGLSWAVSLGHRKFSDKSLLRIQKGSGLGLLALALIHGVQIVMELVENHRR